MNRTLQKGFARARAEGEAFERVAAKIQNEANTPLPVNRTVSKPEPVATRVIANTGGN